MGVTLIDLTAEELDAMRPAMIATFAESVAENFGIPLEQALIDGENDLATMLPDGVATPGHLLRKAMDGDQRIGYLWLSLPGTFYPSMAWIAEVEVDPGHRSRGYGSQMIRAGEADLAGRGIARLGLHVFGRNDGARRLYHRLGFRVLSQGRSRPVGPVTDPGVELVPMTAGDFMGRLDALIADDPFVLSRDPEPTAEKARRQAALLAPDGVDSAGVFVRTARVDGREVGWLWYSLPNPDRPATGMVHHLTVDPGQRRRGYGRRMFAAAEADLAGHGSPDIGLSVPGRPGALAFADALGLPIGSQQMVKDL